jgi:hypothetical protein
MINDMIYLLMPFVSNLFKINAIIIDLILLQKPQFVTLSFSRICCKKYLNWKFKKVFLFKYVQFAFTSVAP